MEALYWLIIAAVFIVLEILTMGLTTIWFAGGALLAALTAMLFLPLAMQIAVFLLGSIALLLITRPIATKFVNSKALKTNAESLVGQRCLVTKAIDNLRSEGEVIIRGLPWTARSIQPDIIIPPNSIVKVESISGVKLMVSVVSLPENLPVEENN